MSRTSSRHPNIFSLPIHLSWSHDLEVLAKRIESIEKYFPTSAIEWLQTTELMLCVQLFAFFLLARHARIAGHYQWGFHLAYTILTRDEFREQGFLFDNKNLKQENHFSLPHRSFSADSFQLLAQYSKDNTQTIDLLIRPIFEVCWKNTRKCMLSLLERVLSTPPSPPPDALDAFSFQFTWAEQNTKLTLIQCCEAFD